MSNSPASSGDVGLRRVNVVSRSTNVKGRVFALKPLTFAARDTRQDVCRRPTKRRAIASASEARESRTPPSHGGVLDDITQPCGGSNPPSPASIDDLGYRRERATTQVRCLLL